MPCSTRLARLARVTCALLAVSSALAAACGSRPAPPPRDPVTKSHPLHLPPVRRVATTLAAGRHLSVVHHGAPHPARAVIAVGRETWIATPAGVLRFDERLWRDPAHATPFAVIDLAAGLPASGANALLALSTRAVLVGTDRGLVTVSRRGVARGPVVFRGLRVTALTEALVGTAAGLYARRSRRPIRDASGIAVTALAACGRGAYVGTQRRGLLRLVAGTLRPVQGIPDVRVGALGRCAPPSGLLAATTAGIYRVVADRAEPLALWRRHATAVIDDGAVAGGGIVFGTFGAGLRRAGPRGHDVLLAAARVHLVHRDPRGLLVGTDQGLYVVTPGRKATRVPLDGPPRGLITAIALVGATTWVGSFDDGIARLQAGSWTRPAIFDPRITALAVDARGRLFVGTASGLGEVVGDRVLRVADPRGQLARHVSTLRRRGHELWVGTHPGVAILDTRRDPPATRYVDSGPGKLAGPAVYGIAFSGATATAWIGTADGLTALHRGEARTLTDLGGVLPDNWINDVRAAGDSVYALTLRSGWLRVTPGAAEVFSSSLMTSPSAMLLLDDQLVFGSNDRGLVVAERRVARSATARLRAWGPAEGLPSRLVAALAHDPRGDRLLVGGDAGLSVIDDARAALGRSGDLRRPPENTDRHDGVRDAHHRAKGASR